MTSLLFEREAYKEGAKLICGVDEVGRGPIAGPVVAVACIMPIDETIEGIDDSKKLNRKKRELIFNLILENCHEIGIGYVLPERIDKINILYSSLEAMKKSVTSLSILPDYILVDGIYSIPLNCIRQKIIVKGDRRSYLIAAASIVAKVIRDRFMELYDIIYPGYNFSQNSGYPTKEHIQKLKILGPSPIHRKSFKPVKNFEKQG